jgi:hypothetical protein
MYCFNLAAFHVADRWEMSSFYCKGEMVTLHYRIRVKRKAGLAQGVDK